MLHTDPKGDARRSSYGVKALDNMNNYSLRALPCLITAYLSQKKKYLVTTLPKIKPKKSFYFAEKTV